MSADSPSAMEALRAEGAPRFDAVGWHHIETLAERGRSQSAAVQPLLARKLQLAMDDLQSRMTAAQEASRAAQACTAQTRADPSPLAALVLDMQARNPSDTVQPVGAWRAEHPRIRQFRKQLSQISVQKQVTQAMALAPQNAGPINSHMLVLRSLGLMRRISPDYLNRFMGHVDTLLCLDGSGKTKPPPKKGPAAAKSPK